MILGKALFLSVPQFPHLCNGILCLPWGCCGGLLPAWRQPPQCWKPNGPMRPHCKAQTPSGRWHFHLTGGHLRGIGVRLDGGREGEWGGHGGTQDRSTDEDLRVHICLLSAHTLDTHVTHTQTNLLSPVPQGHGPGFHTAGPP